MSDQVEQSEEIPNSEAAGNDTAAEDDNSEAAGQDDGQEGDGTDSQEQTGDDADEEVDIGDVKVVLPKAAAEKLKAERLMHADYTKKTQEVAEQRKDVEARQAQVQKHAEEAQHYLDEITEIKAIDKQLSLYKNIDWPKLISENQAEAMLYQQQQRELEQQRYEAVGKITTKQNERALAAQQESAKQVQDAETYFKREIPGYTKDRIDALVNYGAENGLPKEVLQGAIIRQPQLAKLLHKAELFDKLEKKQTAKPKPVVQDKPVTRITASRGGSAAVRDPDKMSMEDWLKWREKQRKAG